MQSTHQTRSAHERNSIIIYLLSFGVVTFNYECARRANHWLKTDMENVAILSRSLS